MLLSDKTLAYSYNICRYLLSAHYVFCIGQKKIYIYKILPQFVGRINLHAFVELRVLASL